MWKYDENNVLQHASPNLFVLKIQITSTEMSQTAF